MESDHPTFLLKETSPETTMENHIFFMKEDDFAYETFQELKASFKMSVWIEADGKRHKLGQMKLFHDNRVHLSVKLFTLYDFGNFVFPAFVMPMLMPFPCETNI